MIKEICEEILYQIGIRERWVKRLGWTLLLSPTIVDLSRSGILHFLEWTVCWKGILIMWVGAYILWLSSFIRKKYK